MCLTEIVSKRERGMQLMNSEKTRKHARMLVQAVVDGCVGIMLASKLKSS